MSAPRDKALQGLALAQVKGGNKTKLWSNPVTERGASQ